MKLQGEKKVNFNYVLYVPHAVKNLLRALMLVEKGATMVYTKAKINIKKNGISVTMNARKKEKLEQCST